MIHPHIFIINLKKDVEKKQHMQKSLDSFGVDYQFIDAIYGKELTQKQLNEAYDESRALNEIGRVMTPGEIGCALSHIHIYTKMIEENIEYAIILEDDVKVKKYFIEAIESIKEFPMDWECVLLCYYRITSTKKLYAFSYHDRIRVSRNLKIGRFIEPMHSTAGYVINLSGAKKLLSHLSKGIYLPIDGYTGDEKFINLYGLHPRVIEVEPQFGFQSNLTQERSMTRKNISEYSNKKPDTLRDLLKRFGLFHSFKRLNLLRMELLKPITQLIYCALNFKKLFILPKKYSQN